jgi:2-methylfumaryl-CoA hydratase
MNTKTRPGNYFEDFRLGQEIDHATPRTVTDGDVALYTALFGSRFAVNSSDVFAAGLGLERAPIDSLLAFHVVFGKTVPDISLAITFTQAGASATVPGDTLDHLDGDRARQDSQDRRGLRLKKPIGVNNAARRWSNFYPLGDGAQTTRPRPARQSCPNCRGGGGRRPGHARRQPLALTPRCRQPTVGRLRGRRADQPVDAMTIEEAEAHGDAPARSTARVRPAGTSRRTALLADRLAGTSSARSLCSTGSLALSVAAINSGRRNRPSPATRLRQWESRKLELPPRRYRRAARAHRRHQDGRATSLRKPAQVVRRGRPRLRLPC